MGVRFWQLLTVILTTTAYIAMYLLRKPVGVVKADLESSYKLTKNQLGWLDSSFFLPYALMQIFFGSIGDRFGARLTITLNLIIAGLSMISFGFWTSPLILAFLLFISGLAQATLWPNCTKCMSEWFPPSEIDRVFGIVGSFIYAGGIAGTSLAVYLQHLYAPDLRLIFMLPSVVAIATGILVYVLLKSPGDVGVVIDREEEKGTEEDESTHDAKDVLSFMQTWRIPLVRELALTMFGIKLVRYCFYMWLPLYLYENLKYTKESAGYLSNAFEVGCIVGSTSTSFLISKYLEGKTHWGVCYSIFGSACALLLFQVTSAYGVLCNFISMFLVGACQGGPDMLITGALAIDAGKQDNAQAAVCGILNGFGSLGTIVQGPVIGMIVTYFGWSGSFYFMISLTLFSTVFIGRAAVLHGLSENVPGPHKGI